MPDKVNLEAEIWTEESLNKICQDKMKFIRLIHICAGSKINRKPRKLASSHGLSVYKIYKL